MRRRLRSFDLDLAFSLAAPALKVVIGPSGGGKTTLLRMLTGLDRPDEGLIRFGDEVWFDSVAGINLPPRKRRLGYVFQDYTLFPHLSMFENAAFAAKDRGFAGELMELFGIGHLRERKPHMVSGGERQRCAICQAMAYRPHLLLLDEPFSALDILTRRKLRGDLKALQQQFNVPVLFVTHDIQEALFLADDILPVVDGKLKQDWLRNMIALEWRSCAWDHSRLRPAALSWKEMA